MIVEKLKSVGVFLNRFFCDGLTDMLGIPRLNPKSELSLGEKVRELIWFCGELLLWGACFVFYLFVLSRAVGGLVSLGIMPRSNQSSFLDVLMVALFIAVTFGCAKVTKRWLWSKIHKSN